MSDLPHKFKIEKSVRLNMKDYIAEDKHVDLVKINTKDNVSILVVSETLSYQAHVQFQTLMLPLRVSLQTFNAVNRLQFWVLKLKTLSLVLTYGVLNGQKTLIKC